MSLVTASEPDTVQTEALTGNVVFRTDLQHPTEQKKSSGTERDTG